MKQHSGVELLMDVTNKSRVIERLENNTVDFSLVSVLPDKLNIEKLDLLQNKLFLVGNAERKFRKDSYAKDIFKNLPLIYREKGSGTRHTMEAFIERNHIPVVKKMELTSNEAVKQAVIAGLAYSIMPLIGIKNELHDGDLQIVSVNELPIKTVWRLIWPKGKKHSPVAEAYLSHIKKHKSEIVKEKFDWYEQY